MFSVVIVFLFGFLVLVCANRDPDLRRLVFSVCPTNFSRVIQMVIADNFVNFSFVPLFMRNLGHDLDLYVSSDPFDVV